MIDGIKKTATIVGLTLGPLGKNILLSSNYGSPKVINDGVTVARAIVFINTLENIGVKVVKIASISTNENTVHIFFLLTILV